MKLHFNFLIPVLLAMVALTPPAEADSRSDAMFLAMDTNGDGFLTREELAAGHEKLLRAAR
jgi:hypothetical protein